MKRHENRQVEILLLEGGTTQRERLQHLLVEHGYAVVATANGKEALEAARSRRPALIISDVAMPELDGYGLSETIKADPELKDVPIVLATTLSHPQDVIRALHCGADNLILRPYEKRHLLSRIDSLLTNIQLRKRQRIQAGVELVLGGERHLITAEPKQILDLLVSIYDQAVQINGDLKRREARHKAALEELNDGRREVSAILENLHDCVITIDDQGIIRSANAAVERVLGYAVNEIVGRNVSILMPEPNASAHDAYMERYLRTGEARVIGLGREVEGLHKNGQLIPLHLGVSEYSMKGGRRFVGALHDISERKRFVDELTQARADAEEASRAKSAFLAVMSHEIRTPMNGVVGMAEILAHSGLPEEQGDMVRVIQESASTLLTLIDDILDFSKIEAGRLEIEQAPVSVSGVVESVCGALVPLATARNVDLFTFVAPDIPARVLSDEVRLRQVLYNIAGNAIKFSGGRPGKSGRVSIRVGVRGSSPLCLVFRVSDNGIGIAPDRLDNLFTAFTQAEVSTTRRFGGSGLGLAICKRLIDLMQGQISVESERGAGSVFTVTLPVEVGTGGVEELPPALDDLDCILIAGPDLNRDDLSAYLRHAGACTHRASDLTDAATQASRLSASVVIHDAWREQVGPERLKAAFAEVPNARHLLITRGWRRRARVDEQDMVTLDGNALSQRALADAVAMAAGRGSPEFETDRARKPQRQPRLPAPSIADARATGRLTLIVEDDPINQKVILRQLGLLGFAAEVAGNGAEALRLWRTGSYALLLLDLHMPDMDGYTLAATIRREEGSRRRTPLLALTANALRGEAKRARAAGMDDYLTKPIKLQVLDAALNRWMPKSDAWCTPIAEQDGRAVSNTNSVLDLNVLRNLVGNDRQAVHELLGDYLKSARALISEMQEACAANEFTRVASIAHKLKSSSRSVGALALGDFCAELENAGKTCGKPSVLECGRRAEEAMIAVEARIMEFLGRR